MITTETTNLDQIHTLFAAEVEEEIKEAKLSIALNDGAFPLFMYAKADGSGCYRTDIDLTVTTTDQVTAMMRDICKDPEVVTAALVIDSYLREMPTEEAKKVPDDVDLSKDPECGFALFTFVYTREGEKVRIISHAKQPDGGPWFSDRGWEDINPAESTIGRFGNPFKPE